MKYNPETHHRRSIRLKDYNYAQSGAYFITICCQNKECLLGKIKNGKMQMNECGNFVEKCWNELQQRFPTIQLDQFIIMPNHIHAIIIILQNDLKILGNTEGKAEGRASPAPTLWDVVRILKSISTIKINRYLNRSGVRIWQRNYYEHIIRDETELDKIREYIINNPVTWESDENYI